jgi:carbonic anhydrase
MKLPTQLFQNNKIWADAMLREDPLFFSKLLAQHSPEYLWIGCSDSRVPANEIIGLLPGELFVHRNIANVVSYNDFNCLSVLQFAVDHLKVKHVIVCGHYGCAGVLAAIRDLRLGLVDNWLRSIQDIYAFYREELDSLSNPQQREDRLCEINVFEQVLHLQKTTIVQDAWKRGQDLSLHGCIYSIADGLMRDLGITLSSVEEPVPLCPPQAQLQI